MDQYLHAIQANLKLAEQAIKLRQTWAEDRKKGMSNYYNVIAHTKAMLAAVDHASFVSTTHVDGWWEEPEAPPF